jgi:hypothetical protein
LKALRWIVPLAAAGAAVLAFVVAPLVLPSIATQRLRDSLARNGQGVHVSISASPAIKLLWGHADSVHVSITRFSSASGHVGDLLARASKTDRLDVHVGQLTTHGLVLTGVAIQKRGSELIAHATVTQAAIKAVLPFNLHLDPSSSSAGRLIVAGNVSIFGQTLSGSAVVRANGGRIELSPNLPLLDSVLHVTLFGNPQFSIDTVTAVNQGDRYTFSLSGHYL